MTTADGGARFWRSSLIVCAVLALVALGLGAAGLVRTPGLVSASIAADRAVNLGGERLVLKGRLPLAPVEAGQVSVTPAVPFTVQTKESAVTVRFSGPLAYGTEYRVSVAGVRSQYTNTVADWNHVFRTPRATLYTLIAHRGAGADMDTVVTNAKGEQTVLLSAPGIEDYVVTREHLIAISRADADTSALVAASRRDGAMVEVKAPAVPMVTGLGVAADGSKYGYLATGEDGGRNYASTLFIADASNLGAPPAEVSSGGAPLSVQDWQFVPGANAVVVVTPQEQAFLIYLDGDTPPVPLGSLAQLVRFLPGSSTLMAEGAGKQLLLDLATGLSSEVENTPDPDKKTFVGRRSFVSVGDYLVEFNTFRKIGSGQGGVSTQLVHVTRAGRTDLLTVKDGDGHLLNSGISPNGQFGWAVVLDPDAPLTDLFSGASDNARTLIFDLATGKQVAAEPGSAPAWAP
ncbi:MAG: hypothetical protein QM711_13860 [Micropruina sp.]|uniref:hypothetical protein n=1 Tax=Micropruina sp. TaxID=2737536 RepID=UPI0039E38664